MLSELHEVAGSLDRFGLTTPEVHPWVKPLSKGSFLIANLDRAGTVRAVEIRSDSDATGIPKIQKDNQNAFPTFKLACPLFEIGADAAVRTALKGKNLANGERASLAREAIAQAPLASVEKNAKRLGQVVKFASELHGLLNHVLPESSALARLMDVLLKCDFDSHSFLRALADGVLAALERGEDAKTAELVLIGEVKKNGKLDDEDLPLVFDVFREPGDDFVRVAHAKTGIFYSKALLQRDRSEPDGVCAITGEFTALERGNLPSPRLPALADTILFSANPDIPCLQRYELIGAGAFPIGQQVAQKLNSTALWITATERKAKTWSLVPRSDDSGRDLVLAYLDLHPDLNADLAELLSDSDIVEREGVFESKAASVLKAIDELQGKLATAAVLHTLVLRRISKGQVQVEVSRQYQVDRIREALLQWTEAAANAPPLSLLVPAGKGNRARLISPRVLFPGEIVEGTKWTWIRGGTERQSTTGLSLASVYDLYLGEGSISTAAASSVLERVLRGCTPLLLLTGDQLTRFGRSVRELKVPARYDAVTAVSLLGIALFKLGRKKESYMKETAFLLGRMLALSDVLHAQYCRAVRGGDLPPQLLGNQHYSMAAERPHRAFAVLGERLRVYRAWAQTARDGGELQAAVRIARWAVKEMGAVADELHGKLPDRGLKDFEKAEMMLGYLARGAKETEDTNDEQ